MDKYKEFIQREMEDAKALCLLNASDPELDSLREFVARCEEVLK